MTLKQLALKALDHLFFLRAAYLGSLDPFDIRSMENLDDRIKDIQQRFQV